MCTSSSSSAMSMINIFLLLTILLLWGACFSSANETDKLSLLAFKFQLTANPQNALSSWNDSLHVCEWEGITCGRRHQRVTVLDLPSKGLGGPISPHIGNMSFLRMIRLFNNSFYGDIPQELGRLFRLENLSLDRNSLVGEIPGNISHCSNLKDLRLPLNNLTGKIPMELGSLAKLVILSLGANSFYGGIPPSVGNLTSLQILSLSDNPNLGGNIPTTFHLLRNVKEFDLNSCNLSGTFPSFFYNNLSAIEGISIYGNQLTRNFHTGTVVNLPNLEHLFIGKNQVSGHIPISLFNSSRLQKIDLGSNQFTGKVPLNIGNLNLQNLVFLSLGGNTLGSRKSGDLDFVTSLTNCTRLQTLIIAYNNFGGKIPNSIGNFSNQLQKLRLDENHLYGTIPPEVESLHGLVILVMNFNSLNGKIPTGIGNLQNLERLFLDNNHLSGKIPSSMSNMSKLFQLDMSYNNLEGYVTSALASQKLQQVYLSHNYFIGNITKRDTRLSTSIITLNMSYNYMSGYIPLEIGALKNLELLDISHNNFSGELPSTLGSCSSLEHLNLQGNLFHGFIPPSLSSIKGLQDLNLSSNNFSGKIPKELEKLAVLEYLDLSFNLLEGEVPLEGIFRNASAFFIAGNNKICGGISQLKLPKCDVLKSKKHGIALSLKVALCVLIPSFLVAALFLVIYLWKKPKAKPSSELCTADIRRVSYIDLHKATEGFAATNLIGTGSYGSVYKGTLQQDEGVVAVKVLKLMEHGASKSFLRECEALRELRHRNLLKILTVCSSVDFSGNDFKALVFEFMPNGSLENWLHPKDSLPRNLNFYQRLRIAIDVATALNYLHNDSERPIVHCDLKPSNILLNEDMSACVGDFGLAKFLSKSTSAFDETDTISVVVRGTIGYIPPEYGMGAEVSKQGDVYSYGILLLEMFTGERPTDLLFKDGLSLHAFCKAALPHRVFEVIDVNLSDEATRTLSPLSVDRVKESFSAMVRIGVACSMEKVDARMDIKQVLKEMHSVHEVLLSVSSHEQASI